ncbi:hypothetical protein NH286_04415 [Anaerococcus sp. NML200574]|uniref:hypothetical protein n=1 Tax=Anaerococcus sp. NML200574 TaxID=2954486 RepID=UPI0022387BC3|nr:hypothetical protein [Anaerococcus sp. NML200574]MCW6678394.1 hypothetical protein [Anaerococcus sp. NML200574]
MRKIKNLLALGLCVLALSACAKKEKPKANVKKNTENKLESVMLKDDIGDAWLKYTFIDKNIKDEDKAFVLSVLRLVDEKRSEEFSNLLADDYRKLMDNDKIAASFKPIDDYGHIGGIKAITNETSETTDDTIIRVISINEEGSLEFILVRNKDGKLTNYQISPYSFEKEQKYMTEKYQDELQKANNLVNLIYNQRKEEFDQETPDLADKEEIYQALQEAFDEAGEITGMEYQFLSNPNLKDLKDKKDMVNIFITAVSKDKDNLELLFAFDQEGKLKSIILKPNLEAEE